MSRAGRAIIRRPTTAEKCAQAAMEMAMDIAPACRDAIGFLVGSLTDFVASPLDATTEHYCAHLEREGGGLVSVTVPELHSQYETLNAALLQEAGKSSLVLPEPLIHPPTIVTAAEIRARQEALGVMREKVLAKDERAAKLREIAARQLLEQQEAQDAAARLRLAVGAGIIGPDTAAEKMREALCGMKTAEASRLGQEAIAALSERTEGAWVAMVLAAGKLAAQDIGLAQCELDVEGGRLRASAPECPKHTLEITAQAASNEIAWDLAGYEEDACAEAEENLVTRFSSYLGLDLRKADFESWSTRPAEVEAPGVAEQTTHFPEAEEDGGADRSREGER